MAAPNNSSTEPFDNVGTTEPFDNVAAFEAFGNAGDEDHTRAISATLDEAGFIISEDGRIVERSWASLKNQIDLITGQVCFLDHQFWFACCNIMI